ncbi:MAG: hypothetical protein AB7O57_10095 [Hyphomicrobiaceae bacterium]
MLDKVVNFILVNAAIVLPAVVLLALLVSSTARRGFLALLRIIARPLLIAAVVALAYDGTRTMAGGSGTVVTSLGEHWTHFAPASLEWLKALLTAKVHPLAWEVAARPVLRLPAWLVAGVLGLLLAWLGRRRKDVPIFIN